MQESPVKKVVEIPLKSNLPPDNKVTTSSPFKRKAASMKHNKGKYTKLTTRSDLLLNYLLRHWMNLSGLFAFFLLYLCLSIVVSVYALSS